MITKAEVIQSYLSSKIEAEDLLKLLMEEDDPGYEEKLEHIKTHIVLIDIFIQRINQEEPTAKELQSLYNLALCWGTNSN